MPNPHDPFAGTIKVADTLRRLTILDTSIASTNVGDEIIMDAVNKALAPVFSDAIQFRVASHERMSSKSRTIIKRSDLAIAGGSNLLSSHAALRSVWKLSPLDVTLGKKFVMMGVGWYHDQGGCDPLTRWLYRSLFSQTYVHSVRDGYTERKLRDIGLENIKNTGCPTLWLLPEKPAEAIPAAKSDTVITTVNTYMPDPSADKRMLDLLASRYGRVAAWVQTDTDQAYLKSLLPSIEIVAPNLRAFDDFLSQDNPVDYVGNRLHGGIRAMQKKRRTIILEIDNRAREMSVDFRLPTIARHDFEKLAHMIETPFVNQTRPPFAAAQSWLAQFSPPSSGPIEH